MAPLDDVFAWYGQFLSKCKHRKLKVLSSWLHVWTGFPLDLLWIYLGVPSSTILGLHCLLCPQIPLCLSLTRVPKSSFSNHLYSFSFSCTFQSCTMCLGYTMQVQASMAASSSVAALPSPVLHWPRTTFIGGVSLGL